MEGYKLIYFVLGAHSTFERDAGKTATATC